VSPWSRVTQLWEPAPTNSRVPGLSLSTRIELSARGEGGAMPPLSLLPLPLSPPPPPAGKVALSLPVMSSQAPPPSRERQRPLAAVMAKMYWVVFWG
jgi:hypothetical protein